MSDQTIHAVQHLSLSLKQGEILAVVGESGCGKTMLCRSLLGLLPVGGRITEGSVLAGGTELTTLPENKLRSFRGSFFSMVMQDPMTSLDPTLTVGKQIAAAIRLHHPKRTRTEVKKQVVELMETVGIERASERCNLYPWQLSGGMRQRCVLAAALACEPQVLIADEPTTALDVTIQAQILKLLKSIREKTGITILFISHDLGVVAGLADRVAIMQNGEIVEIAPADQIYHNPAHPYTKKLLASLPSNAKAFKGAVPTDHQVLQISHLTHNFRMSRQSIVRAVSDLSFQLRKGEIFSLVGESGSGKSTVARCILGMYEPTEGKLEYEGISLHPDAKITRAERKKLQQEIQIISQDSASSLNPHMTVREVIGEPLRIHSMYSGSALENYILEMLEEVHLEKSLIDRPVTMLSGGQRQRVSIARAFGAQPKLLVADEPLASLDVTMQMQIVELFGHLVREHDTSMLFIAHDLSMVRFLSTRVGVMYRGHLVESADTEELYRHPLHPYTRSLLEAMPIPDPDAQMLMTSPYEGVITGLEQWKEVRPGHFVLT